MNRLLLTLPFLAAIPPAAFASETGTALLTGSATGPTTSYSAVINNTSTDGSTIGTFWFAWIPGQDYLATSPVNITSPTGWTDVITHGGATDGYAIQWKATSASSDLAAGSSLSGFGFSTADTLAQLQGNSVFYPTTPVGTSFFYAGTPLAGVGDKIVASAVAAPEPASLASLALGGLLLLRRRP